MATTTADRHNHGDKTMRVVEFYAGVGGWHYAFKRTGLDIQVVAAVDINTTSNKIYRHNFPATRHLQRNICGLTERELDAMNADMFTLSPPCQPFTRQGKHGDTDDHRTDSFFHLMHVLAGMESPPTHLMMENVKGFEVSETRKHFVGILDTMGYHYREFLLSPTQFGIPNSRTRYYLLAKRRPCTFNNLEADSICKDPATILSFLGHHKATSEPGTNATPDTGTSPVGPASTLSAFLEPLEERGEGGERGERGKVLDYLVPDKVLVKCALGLDIVRSDSTSCCCFTRGYFHYSIGTGSVVQHNQGADLHACYQLYTTARVEQNDAASVEHLRPLQLRYFTPREVANLMCFPPDFSLPPDVTLRQSYQTLGNSVNVLVVSSLVKYLITV